MNLEKKIEEIIKSTFKCYNEGGLTNLGLKAELHLALADLFQDELIKELEELKLKQRHYRSDEWNDAIGGLNTEIDQRIDQLRGKNDQRRVGK